MHFENLVDQFVAEFLGFLDVVQPMHHRVRVVVLVSDLYFQNLSRNSVGLITDELAAVVLRIVVAKLQIAHRTLQVFQLRAATADHERHRGARVPIERGQVVVAHRFLFYAVHLHIFLT